MKKISVSYFLLVIVCFSCDKPKNEGNKSSINRPLTIDSVAVLDETNYTLGQPASFSFISETDFVLATKQGDISIYNLEGKRKHTFRKIGTGPLEYLDASYISVHENKIFVWCKQLLKLVVFDLDGTPLMEYNNFSNAIRDFEIVNDKVFFYISGAASSSLIEVYDLESQRYLTELVRTDEESALLNMLACVGGLIVKDKQVYYVSSGNLAIGRIDPNSLVAPKVTPIMDPEFSVEKLSLSKYEEIGNNIGLRIDFVNKNSSVGAIQTIDNLFVIRTEVGEYEYENRFDPASFDRSNRFEKYLVLDESMNLLRSYKGPISNTSNCLIESNGKSLFSISAEETSGKGDFYYQLNRINLVN